METTSRTNTNLLVTLGGNVGNQLFQIAGALTLVGGDFGRLLIDNRFTYMCNGPQLSKVISPTCLNIVKRRQLIRCGLWPFKCVRSATVHHAFQKAANLSGRIRTLYSDPNDNQLHAEEYYLDSNIPTQVMGYFQHMKWVTGSFKYLQPYLLSASEPMNLCNLGVSIRIRNDYAGNRLNPKYYESAARLLSELQPSIQRVIITGDSVAELGTDCSFWPNCEYQCSEKWFVQFNSLSTCGLSILSNSTFAWWAAWVAHNRRQPSNSCGPHTIFPSDWFHTSLTDIKGWAPIERGNLW